MAASRAYKFPADFLHLSLICKALSHPARIEIIHLILQKTMVTFKEINNNIPLQPPTVSQHIRYLKEMNIIEFRDRYPYTYSFNDDLPSTCKELIKLVSKAKKNQTNNFANEIPQMMRMRGTEIKFDDENTKSDSVN